MNAMYLAYNPPQMLPTQTLNPTSSPTGAGGAKSTGSSHQKRSTEGLYTVPLNARALERARQEMTTFDSERWWWVGAGMIGLGSFAYYFF